MYPPQGKSCLSFRKDNPWGNRFPTDDQIERFTELYGRKFRGEKGSLNGLRYHPQAPPGDFSKPSSRPSIKGHHPRIHSELQTKEKEGLDPGEVLHHNPRGSS